ncbi:MAG: GMC family oxidoreductase [Firmicutes bacterium]|nr:GMC family oxidoreductase [Bacillota bacterium]
MNDTLRKTAIVIGSGAGGATIARELQGRYNVTILEEGKEFKPFGFSVPKMAKFRPTRLYFDERLIRLFLPAMLVEKTKDMVMVRGIGTGGTTTLATGNAVRYDGAIRELGIDLDKEFEELYQELPITTDHQKNWTKTTRDMYQLFEDMGLDPVVTPKLMDAHKCVACGHCAIGCPTGAKWDTRAWLDEAVANGARLITGCKVTSLKIKDGKVVGVKAWHKGQRVMYLADLVILAAGGLGTPVILEKSGIPCQKSLFVDPVLCVAGEIPGLHQDVQVLMPFISQQDGYILSPYMDYLSFFFNKNWFKPMKNIASVMIKLADEEVGSTDGRKIDKSMTALDNERMAKAVEQSRGILEKMGVPREKQFLGTLNAGHPGGMLPLTEAEKDSLHNPALPENLYVADATILPKAMGNPPILTIMALAKKIAGLL